MTYGDSLERAVRTADEKWFTSLMQKKEDGSAREVAECVKIAIEKGNLHMTRCMLEKGGAALAYSVRAMRLFNIAIRGNNADMLKLLIEFGCVSFDGALMTHINFHDANTRAIAALFESAPESFLDNVSDYTEARHPLRQMAQNYKNCTEVDINPQEIFLKIN